MKLGVPKLSWMAPLMRIGDLGASGVGDEVQREMRNRHMRAECKAVGDERLGLALGMRSMGTLLDYGAVNGVRGGGERLVNVTYVGVQFSGGSEGPLSEARRCSIDHR